jgi:hypothetical protein
LGHVGQLSIRGPLVPKQETYCPPIQGQFATEPELAAANTDG